MVLPALGFPSRLKQALKKYIWSFPANWIIQRYSLCHLWYQENPANPVKIKLFCYVWVNITMWSKIHSFWSHNSLGPLRFLGNLVALANLDFRQCQETPGLKKKKKPHLVNLVVINICLCLVNLLTLSPFSPFNLPEVSTGVAGPGGPWRPSGPLGPSLPGKPLRP